MSDTVDELDPTFGQPHEPPLTSDDTLDTGITGPDGPEVDPEFSRPSQGLEEDLDPDFPRMPLPEDFTLNPLTDTSVVEYAPWELLAQFPYLISKAIRISIDLGNHMGEDERYQLLHDAKVYLDKAIEFYDREAKPYLFTEDGYIKGTQLGCIGFTGSKAVTHAAMVRMAFTNHNRFVCALLDVPKDVPASLSFWGLKVANLEAMLKQVVDNMEAIELGRNREEIKEEVPLMMRISDAGIDLIKSFEGLELNSYKCPAGIWTIGYGHTGTDVHDGQTITEAEAEDLLRVDLLRFEDGVNKLIQELDITQGMYDALVSFAYNVGLDALARSTLLKLLKQGEALKASDEFAKWNKAGGKVLDGLTRRRRAEADLFLS